ncbi:DUF6985 domain-containing protein [Spirosoma soli]|uniref:DUF6985 domain-containing protein n=1 Tax=Spirosoma soli TaxID=1770529 RepID=A0ABW5MBN7_9BACT
MQTPRLGDFLIITVYSLIVLSGMFSFQGDWEFNFTFKAFEGLQSRQGAYAGLSSQSPSDGKVRVVISDELDDNPDPLPEQINAINFIIENPALIQNALLEALDKEYPILKECYGDEEEFFPEIHSLEDYKHVFGVGNLFVLYPHKDGYAYIGIECGCIWDEEHGLGFMLHKDRVITVGAADTAFSSLDAYKDNGTYEQKQKEWNGMHMGSPLLPKPKIYTPHQKYGKLKPSQMEANRMYENNLIERGYNQEFIDLVESGKVDINVNNGLNMSYLERATQFNNEVIARYIISRKPVTLKNAIHNATGHANRDLIAFLIENGADINEQNHWKITPLSITQQNINRMRNESSPRLKQYEDLLDWLKSKGAK